ncbi:MAG: DNA translocase FtsK [Planctomycetes bacterium]|nr:DNA translocase FtsK [Planctomycetota bacterium]
MEKWREAFALLLFGAVAFVLTSLASYDPDDYAGNVFPRDPRAELANHCGVVGARTSQALFLWFGPTAYLLLGLVSAWSAVLFFRLKVEDVLSRLFGSALFLVSIAALASLLGPGESTRWPTWGGILGIGVSDLLLRKFSQVGTFLVLFVVAGLSLILATDALVFAAARRLAHGLVPFARHVGARVALRISAWREDRKVESQERHADREAREAEEKRRADAGEAEFQAKLARDKEELACERERRREESARRRAMREVEAKKTDEERRKTDKIGQESERACAAPDKKKTEKKERVTASIRRTTSRITRMLGLGGDGEDAEETGLPGDADTSETDLLSVPLPAPGSPFSLPPVELLEEPERIDPLRGEVHCFEKSKILEAALANFKIDAKVVHMDRGPIVTLYELDLAAGIKVSSVTALANDLAMALKAPSIRIQAPIPGKGTVGVEIPNVEKEIVRARDLVASPAVRSAAPRIPLFLGKMNNGGPLVPDLVKMPHLLIAGTTGSGKSVCINTIVCSLLLRHAPQDVKLILIDPKMVELAAYKNVPHLLTPVVTEMNRASAVLEWAVEKMDERYRVLKDAAVRNIEEYNDLSEKDRRRRFEARGEEPDAYPAHLPYLVLVIDELADMMMVARKEVENSIIRLAQKSRAIGIHLIVATQRPSADVITGLIKSNLPSRIAFRVNSKSDSRIVLDVNGAEKLLGGGDLLFLAPGTSDPIRCQGTFMSDKEIRGILHWATAQASPEFSSELDPNRHLDSLDPSDVDPLFDQAVRVVLETKRGSATLLQRRFEIGYSRASRLVDAMEDVGIVGPHRGSKSREILMTLDDWEARQTATAEAE